MEEASNTPTCCEHCGAKIVEYKHSLSRSIVIAFFKVLKVVGVDRVFNIAECDLSYSERENLRKLQYWGLIQKHGDNPKGGIWIITPNGMSFLADQLTLHKNVWTYRGEVVRYDGPTVLASQVMDGWKNRPDYAREAVPHEAEAA